MYSRICHGGDLGKVEYKGNIYKVDSVTRDFGDGDEKVVIEGTYICKADKPTKGVSNDPTKYVIENVLFIDNVCVVVWNDYVMTYTSCEDISNKDQKESALIMAVLKRFDFDAILIDAIDRFIRTDETKNVNDVCSALWSDLFASAK